MKFWLSALFLTCPCWGQLVVQARNKDTLGSGQTSINVPIATSAGNLLVAWCAEGSNSSDNLNISDAATNTWTKVGSYVSRGTAGRSGMFYAGNAAAVTSVTCNFTTTGGVSHPRLMVWEISGADVSSPLDNSVTTSNGASGTACTSGKLTTTNANDILILACDVSVDQSAPLFTAAGGYTIPANSAAIRLGMETETVSVPQIGVTASMGYTKTATFDSVFAAFRAAANPPPPPPPPNIIGLSQTSGTVGTPITITGTNFGAVQGTSTVTFNGTAASPNSWTATSIVALVPPGATTGNVVVTVGGVASNGANFNVLTGTGGITPVQVRNKDALGSGQTSINVPVTTSAGNLLVAWCAEGSNSSDNLSITDTAFNAWQRVGSYVTRGTAGRSGMFYAANAAAVTSVTCSFTTGGGISHPRLMVWEISGVDVSSPLDASAGVSNGLSGTTCNSGNLTTTNANDILILACDVSVDQTGSFYTPGSRYAIPARGAAVRLGMESQIVSTLQTGVTASMGYTKVATFDSIFAAFRAAGNPPPPPPPPPSITSLSQSSGAVGTPITISGANFGATPGSSTVTFNGTAASPSSWSATSIVAPVPAGATTGNLVVTVSGVASNGVNFTVTSPAPSITGLSQISGAVGTPITITGTNFGVAPGTSTVTFNGTAASPSSWSATSIVATVPAGATTGSVVVTVGGVASNGVNFTVPTATGGIALLQVRNKDTLGSGQTSINVPIATSAGDLLVAWCAEGSNSTDNFTITDTATNAWTQVGSYVNRGTAGRSGMFYAGNAAAVTSVSCSFTTAGGASHARLMVWELSGADASSPLDNSVTTSSGPSGTTCTSGNLITSNASDMLILACDVSVDQNGSFFTAGSGYTIPANGASVRLGMQSQTVSAPQTGVTASMGYKTTGTFDNIFAAFRAASSPPPPSVSITGLSQTSATVETPITITGTNFGTIQGTSSVTFNGTIATPIGWSATSIVAPVPPGATTGNVVVTVGGLASNGANFTVIPSVPSITSLSQNSGTVGTPITITGTFLGVVQGTSTVTFNGMAASPTSWSASSIGVTVPPGATTGNVVVTVAGSPSNGLNFTVAPSAPTVSGLSQTSGTVGTQVTITGINFGATQGTSTVTFNGSPAAPTNWSATSITAAVPPGATTGSVVVTVGGMASAPFIPSWGTVDAFLDMKTSPLGATVDSTIVTNGTEGATNMGTSSVSTAGPLNGVTVAPSQGALGGSVTVRGGSTLLNGSTTEAIAFDHTQNNRTFALNFHSGLRIVTISGYITFGPHNAGGGGHLYDYILIRDTTGNYVCLQLNNGNGNGSKNDYSVAIEVSPGAAHSNRVTITPGNKYLVSVQFDGIGGTARAAVFDPVTFAQIGNTMTQTQATGNDLLDVRWGNNESGLDPGHTSYLENEMIDYTNHVFPLIPSGAAPVSFTVTPSITGLSQTSGMVGTPITITGTSFGPIQGASTVTFNGTAASPTSWSDTSIVVQVPAGATTGSVVVTVGGFTSNGVGFTVTPSITSLSQNSGTVGTLITITGTNFGATQGNSTVTFNGTVASPSSWSATGIVAPVPVGAITGNVVVTVGGFTSNGVSFTVTGGPTYALSVSISSDLSFASGLDGGTALGAAYVFTSSAAQLTNSNPSGISQVSYWLDNPNAMGSPAFTSTSAPYTFAGTASGFANPWDTNQVADGVHTITQQVSKTDGSTEVDTATFTVQNHLSTTITSGHYEYVIPDQNLYVYNLDNNFQLVKHVNLPQAIGVKGVAVAPGTHMLYLAYGGNGGSSGNGSLLKYDLLQDTVVWTQSYAFGVDEFSITPDGTTIYMPDGANSGDGIWHIINASSGLVSGSIDTGMNGPTNTIVSLDGTTVFLGPRFSSNLVEASTSTNMVTLSIGPLYQDVRPFTINGQHTLAFTTSSTDSGVGLGFQVNDTATGNVLFSVPVPGFSVSPDFPGAPSNGISLSPDEKEVYLIDIPNAYLHVFDVSLPSIAPAWVADIPLAPTNFSGLESPCTFPFACVREGWLRHTRDGHYVLVGDSGKVIDTTTRLVVGTIPQLINTGRGNIEIDWQNGVPVSTTTHYGLGYVTQ